MFVLMALFICYVFFFFFKQKRAYDMRISDWSSDVCSSDLHLRHGARPGGLLAHADAPSASSLGFIHTGWPLSPGTAAPARLSAGMDWRVRARVPCLGISCARRPARRSSSSVSASSVLLLLNYRVVTVGQGAPVTAAMHSTSSTVNVPSGGGGPDRRWGAARQWGAHTPPAPAH